MPNMWETTHKRMFTKKDPPGRQPVGTPGPRPVVPWMADGTTYQEHFEPKVRRFIMAL